MSVSSRAIGREDLLAARRRIGPHIARTPVLTSRTLDERTGRQVFLKCENFQRTGSFKIRGASHFLSRLSPEELKRGVVAHSSGNHAQAVAFAARAFGTSAVIVMPSDAPDVKRQATEGYGARVVASDRSIQSREEACRRIVEETGRVLVHPYDHDYTIMGQASVALELFDEVPDFDLLLAPVSGGGLISGIALASAFCAPGNPPRVVACEPEIAGDASESLKTGRLSQTPAGPTIADGLRANLSKRTFDIFRRHVADVALVSESEIVETMRFLWERVKIVVEPSGATALAPLLFPRGPLPGARVGVVLSGGNVAFPFPPSR